MISPNSRIRTGTGAAPYHRSKIGDQPVRVRRGRRARRPPRRRRVPVASGSRKSIVGGPTPAAPRTCAPGRCARSIVHSSRPNRCRYRSPAEQLAARPVTAAWLPRPSGVRRCRSCAAASPSRLTPTRTPSSSKSRGKLVEEDPVRLDARRPGRAARRPRGRRTTCAMRRGPASSGSPPCSTSSTRSGRGRATCSAMRAATPIHRPGHPARAGRASPGRPSRTCSSSRRPGCTGCGP